jgi:phycocyanobilin lyase subunit beta
MTVTNAVPVEALIQAVEQADSPEQLATAVQVLVESHSEAGIPTLIAVLGYNNPAAAITAVEGLIQLGEIAVPYLLAQIDDYNYGARAYSFRVLAAIADPRALETLLTAAATDFAPSVRRAAIKGLGTLRWQHLPSDQIVTAQTRAVQTLLQTSQDSDWSIRYAAIVALQFLALSLQGSQPQLWSQVLERLQSLRQQDPDPAIQARAQLAQRQLQAAAAPESSP